MHFVEQKRERPTLCFSSYKYRKLKVKLWWVGSRERTKRVFLVPLILSERNFFNISVLFIVYWKPFQNIPFSKSITTYIFPFVLKSSKAFSVSLIALYTGRLFELIVNINGKSSSVRFSFGFQGSFWRISGALLISFANILTGRSYVLGFYLIFTNVLFSIIDISLWYKLSVLE